MKFRINGITDVNKLVKRYRRFLTWISLVRNLISALFFTSAITFITVAISSIIYPEATIFFSITSLFFLFLFFVKIFDGKISLQNASLQLDDDLKAEYQLVTLFELKNRKNLDSCVRRNDKDKMDSSVAPLSQNDKGNLDSCLSSNDKSKIDNSDKTKNKKVDKSEYNQSSESINPDFVNLINQRVLTIFTKQKQITKPLNQQPLHLIGFIFLLAAILVLILFHKSVVTINQKVGDNSKEIVLAHIAKLEAYAKISDDKNVLKYIESAKSKILSGNFNEIENLIAEINNEINKKNTAKTEVKDFVKKTLSNDISADDLKMQLLNFSKQNPDNMAAAELAEKIRNQKYYSLDEILEILKTNIDNSNNAFVKYFSEVKEKLNQKLNTKDRLSSFEPAKANYNDNETFGDFEDTQEFTKTYLKAEFVQKGNVNLEKIKRLYKQSLKSKYKKLYSKFSKNSIHQ